MKRTIINVQLLPWLLLLVTISANAQREGRHIRTGRGFWHGPSIHHFEVHDRALWRGGRWSHARYGGRLGWWWVVGPNWYFYSRPIYPYPDPYMPTNVIVETLPSQAGTIASPPAQNWYFCPASKEYYPYVSTCPSGWKIVPATPAKEVPSAPLK